eukprot:m51a1_g13959 hypothetical protein (291) ;mRNA; r:950161-951297
MERAWKYSAEQLRQLQVTGEIVFLRKDGRKYAWVHENAHVGLSGGANKTNAKPDGFWKLLTRRFHLGELESNGSLSAASSSPTTPGSTSASAAPSPAPAAAAAAAVHSPMPQLAQSRNIQLLSLHEVIRDDAARTKRPAALLGAGEGLEEDEESAPILRPAYLWRHPSLPDPDAPMDTPEKTVSPPPPVPSPVDHMDLGESPEPMTVSSSAENLLNGFPSFQTWIHQQRARQSQVLLQSPPSQQHHAPLFNAYPDEMEISVPSLLPPAPGSTCYQRGTYALDFMSWMFRR